MRDPSRIVGALSTVHERDPVAMRRRALDLLREATGATFAVSFTLVDLDGQTRYARVLTRGDSGGIEAFEGYAVFPTPTLRPRMPSVRERTRFLPLASRWRDRGYRETSVYRRVHRPLDIQDELRLLVYRGSRMVAWCGVMVRSEDARARLPRHVVARSQHLVEPVVALFTAADQLEEDPSGLRDAYVVADATGRIVHGSQAARGWLIGSRIEMLRRLVREHDRGRGRLEVIDGVGARTVRLDGDGGVHYLVSLIVPGRIEMRADADLTDAQREVARLAASGATIGEMATSLGRSTNTVQTHLREIYRRLGIGSRAELAAALEER